jgi:hypothetical protein
VRESSDTPGQEARVPTPQVPPTQFQVRAVSAENNLVRPARRDFTDEQLRQLSVPPGFSINVFAQGLTNPRVPGEFRHDAFLALRGSWNRNPPTGYKLVRIRFDPQGRPLAFEDFVSGWLLEDGRAHFGRLVGTAVASDGSRLVTDDSNGIVYRIASIGG